MLPELNFENWIAFFFDQSVAVHMASFPENTDWWEGPPADIIHCLTLTFEECTKVLEPFSDAQVAQALEFFVLGSGYMQELKNTEVPLADRLGCVEAMETLFKACFATRCTPHLSHLDGESTPAHVSPLNQVCFGWWYILPLHGMVYHTPNHPDSAALDRTFLDVMRGCLEIDSIVCQESALHGLGEWSPYYEETTRIIDRFLRRRRGLQPELRAWARRMR